MVTVAAGVFIATGVTAAGVGLTHHSNPPQPSTAAAGVLDDSAAAGRAPIQPRQAAQPTPTSQEHSNTAASPSTTRPASRGLVLPPAQPLTLRIPGINVSSQLSTVGLNRDGTVEVPKGAHYNKAAWYRYSPTPGELGPSIILGHVDRATSGPSVFYQLGRLRPGDKILVTRADSRVAVFVVNAVRRYPKTHFPTQAVYGNLDHAGLRLLTCGGTFEPRTGHYLDNIVVFAHLTSAPATSPAPPAVPSR